MKSYLVTVKLRTGETIQRTWTAEDGAEATELTLVHLADSQKEQVERVLVQEKQS